MNIKDIVVKFFTECGEIVKEFCWETDWFLVQTETVMYHGHIDMYGPIGYSVEIDHEWKLSDPLFS